MNKLNTQKRIQVVTALVEGNSLRATARMCDVAFNTVLKLVPEIGKAGEEYQDKTPSATQSKRTFPPISRGSSAMAKCGLGLPSMRKLNLFLAGALERGYGMSVHA